MSDEVTLRDLLDERQKRIDVQFLSIEQARSLARAELEARLHNLNNTYGQLKEQTAAFAQRELTDQKLTDLHERIGKLERIESRMLGYVLGAGGLVGVVTWALSLWAQ